MRRIEASSCFSSSLFLISLSYGDMCRRNIKKGKERNFDGIFTVLLQSCLPRSRSCRRTVPIRSPSIPKTPIIPRPSLFLQRLVDLVETTKLYSRRRHRDRGGRKSYKAQARMRADFCFLSLVSGIKIFSMQNFIPRC